MDKIIAEFEMNHPGWGWLVRSTNGTNIPSAYFCHITSPMWSAISPAGLNQPHFKGYGMTPRDAFVDAISKAMVHQ